MDEFSFSTTTCSYSNPVMYDGLPPFSSDDWWQFASSTCITQTPYVPTDPTVVEFDLGTTPENPLIVQDSGSVVFGLALILFVLVFAILGLVFGSRRRS